ncbi:MAG: NAD(P)-dependent oxidoreductase [Deltaproteobacteria bacterium]|nr:NAD(P)-dependent oxidoreductase [Deltaproteobacteria bacterium]MBW2359461.1 NAD(P)-dependent oxidoreductase [Deltaproteobacteria bacterium]
MNVAFLGLGVMGGPMAGHLASAGHRVSVYNRTRSRAEDWAREHAGSIAATPAEATRGAELVFACVGNDDDVRAITLAPGGAFEALEPQAIFVDHTTDSATLARELDAAARARGAGCLDAPVSGGQSGAEQGRLTVMVGGELAAFDRARPAMEAYARKLVHLGPTGSGQLAKMVNQICIAGTLQGLAEGLHFAKQAGLDAHAVVDAISQGAAQSWQMDNRAATMLEGRYDFGFAVEWMRKDLGLALDESRRNGAKLELAELVAEFYAEVDAQGGRRWDTSSLLARLSSPDGER